MELIPLLNAAVIEHYISLKCWGTLPLGISPLICPSSCAINMWHFFVHMEVFFLYPDFKNNLEDIRDLQK